VGNAPIFTTRREAGRFLVGFAMLCIGILLEVPIAIRGRSHVLDSFWIGNASLVLLFAGTMIGSGPALRAAESMRTQGRSRWTLYSPTGFREAFRVTRQR